MTDDEWPEPRLLIENDTGGLVINEIVAKDLELVEKPLVVVCIAGPYRTGKSYLMNRLAGRQSGFALGSTVESKTKGIWVWVVSHPLDCDKALLLMDTEGLDDVFKGDETYDMWICCLAVLLSSVLVYNIIGRIENRIIEKLQFVAEMSNHIRSRHQDTSDDDFDEFFPSFILSIRDFFLTPQINGHSVTSDEYMEEMLLSMKKPACTAKENDKQSIKEKLRTYFKSRKCFFFTRPVGSDEKLRIVDALSQDELEPEFLDQVNLFCGYIYTTAPVKKLDYVQAVNGRIFTHLTREYVSAIQQGIVPCIQSAMDTVAQNENSKALEEAVKFYCTNMQDLLAFPACPIHFADTHQACHRQAVEVFYEKAFLDKDNVYRDKLQERLEYEYNRIALEDSKASQDKCERVLADLFSYKIDVQLRMGTYITSGGYNKYLQDLDQVKFAYNVTPDKGVKSEEVLHSVLCQRLNEQVAIIMSDEALSEAEKSLEDSRLKEAEAIQQMELLEKGKEEIKRHQQNLLESHNEHMKASHTAFQQKIQEQEEEFKRLIQHRFVERERQTREKFEREAAALRAQLH